MGEWIETEYGKRYMEVYGLCILFFMTEPDEDGKRSQPAEVTEILLKQGISDI
jgi:hypothetical protein